MVLTTAKSISILFIVLLIICCVHRNRGYQHKIRFRKFLSLLIAKNNLTDETISSSKSHIPLGIQNIKLLDEMTINSKEDSDGSGIAVKDEEEFLLQQRNSDFSVVTPEMSNCEEEMDDPIENLNSSNSPEDGDGEDDDDDDEAHDLIQSDQVLKDLYESITSAESMNEIFSLLEEIPAIKKSMDRAMKISHALPSDSILAMETFYRIVAMAVEMQSTNPSTQSANIIHQLEKDRRIEQLVECIDIHLNILSLSELTKYLWSLVNVNVNAHAHTASPGHAATSQTPVISTYIHHAIDEYYRREIKLKEEKEYRQLLGDDDEDDEDELGVNGVVVDQDQDLALQHKKSASNKQKLRKELEEIATTIWTLGCIQDRYSWTNTTLLEHLIYRLHNHTLASCATVTVPTAASTGAGAGAGAHVANPLSLINSRLIVRMLWSITVTNNTLIASSYNPSSTSTSASGSSSTIQKLSQATHQISLLGIEAIKPHFSHLSLTNYISLFWCLAEWRFDHEIDLIDKLLTKIIKYIKLRELKAHEQMYIAEGLRIYSARYRRRYINAIEQQQVQASTPSTIVASEQVADRYIKILLQLSAAMDGLLVIINEQEQLTSSPSQSPSTGKSSGQQTTTTTKKHSLPYLASILRAAATVEIVHSDGSQLKQFLTILKRRIEESLTKEDDLYNLLTSTLGAASASQHQSYYQLVHGRDAAMILEAIAVSAAYPHLLYKVVSYNPHLHKTLYKDIMPRAKSASNANTNATSENLVEDINMINNYTVSSLVINDLSWQKIAGQLAVHCVHQAMDIGDISLVIGAAWSISCLGHSYRPLFRIVRRYCQSKLSKLSAKHLARLTIIIASEEASSFSNGGGLNVKLDKDFVDTIIVLFLKRIHEIDSLRGLVHGLIAIAFLGRFSSSGSRLQWNTIQQQLNQYYNSNSNNTSSTTASNTANPIINSLSLSGIQLSYLTTQEIIRLQWAIGRLPHGIFSQEAIALVHHEVQRRDLLNNLPTNKLTAQDAFLYVKTLVDYMSVKDSSLHDRTNDACQLLVEKCTQLFEDNLVHKRASMIGTSTQVMTDGSNGIPHVSSSITSHRRALASIKHIEKLSILIDSIQALTELKWYNPEMVELCNEVLQEQDFYLNQQHHPTHSSPLNLGSIFSAKTSEDDEHSNNGSTSSGDGNNLMINIESSISMSSNAGEVMETKVLLAFKYGILQHLVRVYRMTADTQNGNVNSNGNTGSNTIYTTGLLGGDGKAMSNTAGARPRSMQGLLSRFFSGMT